MKILEMTACPACGAGEYREFELGGGHVLRRCAACETVFAPEYADPDEVYVDGYMFGQAGKFGLDVRDPVYQQFLARVADQRIEAIEKATGIRSGRLLDVGSGTGEVLLGAKRRGWSTQGVEPERTAAEMARDRGLEVAISTLEESGLPERSYDVVSAFHVLEHLPESRGFLSSLARWARPGGFVTIEVPNFASVQRRRMREQWPNLRPHEHLVHFTPQTLSSTLRAAGIEPIVVRSPAYIGPPQNLDHALGDLARTHGRFRRLVEPLSREQPRVNGDAPGRYPTRLGWAVLHGVERLYDRAGAGTVVFCVGQVG